MQCKIVILSDKVLKGEKHIDIFKISKILLGYGLFLSEVIIKGEDEIFDDFSSSTFLFLHDEKIDDFISRSKVFYSTKSEIINGEAVLAGEEAFISVIPIEADLTKIIKDCLEVIRIRFKLNKLSVFRLFGRTANQVEELLNKEDIKSENFVLGDGLLCDIFLENDSSSSLISEDEVKISQLFADNIYAQSNLEMQEIISKMLLLSNLKVSVMDSFTGGEIARTLLRNNSISNIESETFSVIYENSFVKDSKQGTCYKNESEMAKQMAFLKVGSENINISLVVTGQKTENGYKVYVAIAKKKLIDIYNLAIEGSVDDAISVARDFALFNLIKKLRVKDLEK